MRSNFDNKQTQYISTKSFNHHLVPELSIGSIILFITVLVTCIYIFDSLD
jgi:hypothetical protein